MKTSELIGPALDWAVAKCEGVEAAFFPEVNGEVFVAENDGDCYNPSESWSQGGPIIERESICVSPFGISSEGWDGISSKAEQSGPTPLIAAMRCYVSSKIGDAVEVPEGLK